MKFNKPILIDVCGYPYKVVFVDQEEIKGNDGLCLNNDRIIKIRNDIDGIATELILTHEITHAILCVQGRVYQRKFDVEELCEFMAYQSRTIRQCINQVVNTVAIGEENYNESMVDY